MATSILPLHTGSHTHITLAYPQTCIQFELPLAVLQTLGLKISGGGEHLRGVVQRSFLEVFLTEMRCFPKGLLTQCLKLLEKFQIALPLGQDQFLVPNR